MTWVEYAVLRARIEPNEEGHRTLKRWQAEVIERLRDEPEPKRVVTQARIEPSRHRAKDRTTTDARSVSPHSSLTTDAAIDAMAAEWLRDHGVR